MWNNEQRREVRHMTTYELVLKARKNVLKRKTIETDADEIFAIIRAWGHDAQVLADTLDTCVDFDVDSEIGDVDYFLTMGSIYYPRSKN